MGARSAVKRATRSAGLVTLPTRSSRPAPCPAGPLEPISKPPRLSGARIAAAAIQTKSPPAQPTSARHRCAGAGIRAGSK